MLIDWSYSNKTLAVSHINQEGKFKISHFHWADPKEWIVDESEPLTDKDYRTADQQRCIQVLTRRPSKNSVLDYLDNLPDEQKKDVLDYVKEPEIYFIDIETRADKGFPDPMRAESEITLISIVYGKKVGLLGTIKLDDPQIEYIKSQSRQHLKDYNADDISIIYECFASEFDLLNYFFTKALPNMHIISGWNINGFDWPYLYNRALRISAYTGSKIDVRKSSITETMVKNRHFPCEVPQHKLIVDYMKLYDKWDTTVKIKESSSLNWVANKLIGLKKVSYQGSIDQMYLENYPLYCYYNIIDSVLVQLIHKKQQYINIMFAMAKLAKIRTIDTLSAINVTEGFLRKPLFIDRKIVFVKNWDVVEDEDDESIDGAYVKPPTPGICGLLSVMDFNSLYPTTMRTFTITPENYKGIYDPVTHKAKFKNTYVEIEDTDVITVPFDNKGTRAVFSQTWVSPTKNMLASVYADRKMYQKKKKLSAEKLEEIEKRIRLLKTLVN